MRSAEQFDAARRLIAAGVNDCAIARQIGVPRTTVRDWRCRPQIRPRLVSESPCGVIHDFAALPAAAYCYVLGLYLGDGCISRDRRVWRLRITLDQKYPAIIDRCREAIDMLMPGQRAGIVQQAKGCVDVIAVFETLAVPVPSARSRQEAHKAHRASSPGSKPSSIKRQKSSSSA